MPLPATDLILLLYPGAFGSDKFVWGIIYIEYIFISGNGRRNARCRQQNLGIFTVFKMRIRQTGIRIINIKCRSLFKNRSEKFRCRQLIFRKNYRNLNLLNPAMQYCLNTSSCNRMNQVKKQFLPEIAAD